MKQVSVRISTYTADVSGVCSALYELGGMVVIHDPSGCNSTYNTHDEPRWYEQDSLVFISGLSEMDAIMGDDEKLIRDIVRAAKQFAPRFIALVRTPVPLMIGTDFEAISKIIEQETGIPVFYFGTTGMRSYVKGVEEALAVVAKHMVKDASRCIPEKKRVNLLGVTPLDFSVNKTMESVKQYLWQNGWEIVSCFAMGSSTEELSDAGNVCVNLVLSASGLAAARVLKQRFGIPYVVGLPSGDFGKKVLDDLNKSAADGKDRVSYFSSEEINPGKREDENRKVYFIGETVISRSLAETVNILGKGEIKVICPLETDRELLDEKCVIKSGEEEMREELMQAAVVIADPMYRPICPPECKFISLPHEAFSGRIYRRQIPDLTELSFLYREQKNSESF